MNKKNKVSNNLIFILSIIGIVSLCMNYFYKNYYEAKVEEFHRVNRMDSICTTLVSKLEGRKINNFNLKGFNKVTDFESIISNNNYTLIVYYNGYVCDPCTKFLINTLTNLKRTINCDLYKEFIVIDGEYNRETYSVLDKSFLSKNYYIDMEKYLNKNFSELKFPANFLFFVNNRKQIIYSSYFTSKTKEKLINYLIKCYNFKKLNTKSKSLI